MVNGADEQTPPALDVPQVDVEAPNAANHDVLPDEIIAAPQDAPAIKTEGETVDDMAVESAFAQIAEALGLKNSAPREVVSAFSQLASQAQSQAQQPLQTIEERTSAIVDQVQV